MKIEKKVAYRPFIDCKDLWVPEDEWPFSNMHFGKSELYWVESEDEMPNMGPFKTKKEAEEYIRDWCEDA